MLLLTGAVILYHPTEKVIENINSYINSLEKLYVLDNSENCNNQIKALLTANNKIMYLHDGENRGIAERLNQAVHLSKEIGADWLLTMDQDSYFNNSQIVQYIDCLSSFEEKSEVAMFGLKYDIDTNDTTCRFEEPSHLITSGSFLNLHLFDLIGQFDENLFIDEVDSEYCYRAKLVNYRIVRFTHLFLHHQLGEMQRGLSFKSFKFTPRRLHTPIRVYYMVRNCFYVQRKHSQLSSIEKKKMLNGLLLRIKNNLIYNKKRFLVLKFIITGYLDFKRNKMGKYQA
jgi:rhamnosyltransferase